MTRTRIVPVCPATVGVAMVEVMIAEAPGVFKEFMVVNCGGTWTSTIPVSPRILGVASVEVTTAVAPGVFRVVMVVKG